jgi:hypothetical protein
MNFNIFQKKDKSKTPFGYGQKIENAKTAQDTIPFIECYDNGLFLTATDTYTLIFVIVRKSVDIKNFYFCKIF